MEEVEEDKCGHWKDVSGGGGGGGRVGLVGRLDELHCFAGDLLCKKEKGVVGGRWGIGEVELSLKRKNLVVFQVCKNEEQSRHRMLHMFSVVTPCQLSICGTDTPAGIPLETWVGFWLMQMLLSKNGVI